MGPGVITITVDAILFDMDGTLVDSTKGVIGAWHTFHEKYPQLNVEEILNTAHGVRTVDNLRNYCGIDDPEILEAEALRFEQEIVNCSRQDGVDGIVILPGVRQIMDSLGPANGPNPRWAICTSATNRYATQALQIAGIPKPAVFVAAEDVQKGKPFPDPYLLGAKIANMNPTKCLVVEDAPAGVKSGKAAGCKTLAVITSHTQEQMEASEPDFLVQNLASVSMTLTADGVEVTMTTV